MTDRKFMVSVGAIVVAITSSLEPQTAVIVSAAVATGFTVMKGIVEISERWKDVKLAQIKNGNDNG